MKMRKKSLKQKVKEWLEFVTGPDEPDLIFTVDGVEMTQEEIVKKARADASRKMVIDGHEFHAALFVDSRNVTRMGDCLFWGAMLLMYFVGFTLAPFFGNGMWWIDVVTVAIMMIVLPVGYNKFKVMKLALKKHDLADREFGLIALSKRAESVKQEIEKLKREQAP